MTSPAPSRVEEEARRLLLAMGAKEVMGADGPMLVFYNSPRVSCEPVAAALQAAEQHGRQEGDLGGYKRGFNEGRACGRQEMREWCARAIENFLPPVGERADVNVKQIVRVLRALPIDGEDT